MFELIYSFIRTYHVEGIIHFAMLSYIMCIISNKTLSRINIGKYIFCSTICYALIQYLLTLMFSGRYYTLLSDTYLPYWMDYLCVIAIQLIFCFIFFKKNIYTNLMYILFFEAFIQLSKVCCSPLYIKEPTMDSTLYKTLDLLLIIILILCLSLIIVMFKKHRISFNAKLSKKHIALALYFPMMVLIGYGLLLSNEMLYQFVIPAIAFLLTTLIPIVYMVMYSIMHTYEDKITLDNALTETKNQLARYRFSIELEERIKKERHELKNNYFYIQTLLQEKKYEKLEEYMENVVGEKLENLSGISTGNTLMDFLLNKNIAEAHRYNIKTYIEVIVPNQLSISDDLICTVLLNLLDNAIEASKSVANSDIHVNISISKSYLVCKIKNKIDTNLIAENPELKTTKADAHNHGLGLKIIQESIDKANGMLKINIDNDYFEATAMLPMV